MQLLPDFLIHCFRASPFPAAPSAAPSPGCPVTRLWLQVSLREPLGAGNEAPAQVDVTEHQLSLPAFLRALFREHVFNDAEKDYTA